MHFYLSLNAIKHNLGDSPVLYFPSTADILMETEKNKIISIFKSQIHNTFKYIIIIIISIIVSICFFVGIYCGHKHSQHLKRSLKRFYNNHSSLLSSKIKSQNEEVEMLPLSSPSKSDQPQSKLQNTTSLHREDINIVEDNLDQQNYISKFHIQPAFPNLQQQYTSNEIKIRFRANIPKI